MKRRSFRNRSHYCLWYLNPSLFRMWFKNAAKMWPWLGSPFGLYSKHQRESTSSYEREKTKLLNSFQKAIKHHSMTASPARWWRSKPKESIARGMKRSVLKQLARFVCSSSSSFSFLQIARVYSKIASCGHLGVCCLSKRWVYIEKWAPTNHAPLSSFGLPKRRSQPMDDLGSFRNVTSCDIWLLCTSATSQQLTNL
jgi:hypothetical protein